MSDLSAPEIVYCPICGKETTVKTPIMMLKNSMDGWVKCPTHGEMHLKIYISKEKTK